MLVNKDFRPPGPGQGILKTHTKSKNHTSDLIEGSDETPCVGEGNGDVKTKQVYFPKGGVVTGYMDPPNPWLNAILCSTDDLVRAYQLACDKHGMKPLQKVLHQLKVINNFTDRNETFTLKGERLDCKHSETLEEILKRVQFRTIDLESSYLDEETAIALFDMIEYYEACTRLYLSYNKNIGIRGWQSCAKMLKRTPCLEQLDLRSTGINEQVMPLLGRALRLGSQLSVLHMENLVLSGRSLMILVTAIKINETLRELYLAENKLMPSDGIQLGNLLKFNHRLALLDIRNNHIQDVGMSHLCDGLSEQNVGAGLNTLVLWNNQITYQSMLSLARALALTSTLETLNLGHNNITNEGIHRLKDGLLHNRSLFRIGLQASKISCEGAVALAEYIADSPRLLRLDLRENDIRTGGLMALSLSLKVSKTVTRIDLDKEPKRESGVKDYADQQRKLHQDISNLMLRNRELVNNTAESDIHASTAIFQKLKEKSCKPSELAVITDMESASEGNVKEPPICRDAEQKDMHGEQFYLDLPKQKVVTLESPAFVSESSFVISEPFKSEEMKPLTFDGHVSDLAELEFPPSPMSGASKTSDFASPVHIQQLKSNPEITDEHKFVISRIQKLPSLEQESKVFCVTEAGDISTIDIDSFKNLPSKTNGTEVLISGKQVDLESKETVVPSISEQSESLDNSDNKNPHSIKSEEIEKELSGLIDSDTIHSTEIKLDTGGSKIS